MRDFEIFQTLTTQTGRMLLGSPSSDLLRRVAVPLLVPLLLGASCSADDKPDASGSPSVATSQQADSAVNKLIATGLKQIKDEDYRAAKGTFQAVLDLDPANVYGWYNLGYVAQLQGDEATAIARYTEALTHDKDFSPAIYNLAILTESSDLEAAVALYRHEIAVAPDDAAAYMRLGYALQHLGRDDEGAQMLQKGIELDPSLADAPPPTYP